jgi:hypothetical protein
VLTRITRAVIAISITALLTGCVEGGIRKRYGRMLEIPVDQAAVVGVNYEKAVDGASRGNAAVLMEVFRATPYLDGAGSQLNSGELKGLLARFGDVPFSSILARQPHKVIERVIDDLDFAFGVYDKVPDWSREFPSTYRLGSHRYAKLYTRAANAKRERQQEEAEGRLKKQSK